MSLAVLAQEPSSPVARSAQRAPLADRVAEFEMMMLRTVEGQATELGWRRDAVTDLRPEDYLDPIMAKTCWYTTVHPFASAPGGDWWGG